MSVRSVLGLLLSAFATLAQGCIFHSSFEDSDMASQLILAYGGYTYSSYTIGGSAAGAAFLSDTAALGDGRPSTVTRCQFVNGPVTSASTVRIGVTINTQDGSNPELGVIAALNLSLPVGTVMRVYDAASYPAPGSLIGATTLQQNNTGIVSGWVVPNDNVQSNAVFVEFVNNTGLITANEEFTVGDIFAGKASYWLMKRDAKMGFLDTGKTRFAASGASYRTPQPPIRTANFTINAVQTSGFTGPITQKQAFVTDTTQIDLASLCNEIFKAQVIGFVPWTNYDPATYGHTASKSTPQIVCKTAFLAGLSNEPSITSPNNDQFYEMSMELLESI